MSDLTAADKNKAAIVAASVWNDGKRRVQVTKRIHIRLDNGQSLVKDPTMVIDDPFVIATLEQHDVELIDLDVRGRPKRGKRTATEQERHDNAEALANELGIPPNLIHDAIENGAHARESAIAIRTLIVGRVAGGAITQDAEIDEAADEIAAALLEAQKKNADWQPPASPEE